VSESNADPRLARICEALRGPVEEAVARAQDLDIYHELGSAITSAVAESIDPALRPRIESMVLRQYALPMADRLFRHQTVQWAADLCARRRWRLRLYGRGWEAGRFAEFAHPEVEHGEALRACYQAAAIHLHASINTAVHQRVMECALSGGLPLVRLHRGLVYGQLARAHTHVAARGGLSPVEDRWEAPVADHPEYMAAARQLQRLGYPVRERFGVRRAQYESLGAGLPGPEASELLGDLAEVGFLTPEQFADRALQAHERTAWRRAASRAIARRTSARWTTDALAADMLRLVERALGA
jgi:hypothetical protein